MDVLLRMNELYNKSLIREVNKIEALWQPNVDNNRILLSLASINILKFENFFFREKQLKKSKQALFTYGKCDEYRFKNFKKSNPIIQRAFYYLLSDSAELINSFKNWEFNNHDYWTERGTAVIIIQEILKDNFEKAMELLNSFDNVHEKYPLKEKDSTILKAIIKKDKKEVEELLEFFLLPINHKKCNDTLMLHSQLFSLHATGFAKLAWLKGIEVDVKHSLFPMELLPIKPNNKYELEYDFLNPNYNPKEIINSKPEKRIGFFDRIFKKTNHNNGYK